MRTGDGPRHARGFTYLLLLFALALGGVALAALGERWQTLAQRERETELLFRGAEIRTALERYAAASAGTPAAPTSLDALLSDERLPQRRHWLRRLYTDPFTGNADWRLLRDAQGGITGVASRSRQPALRVHDVPAAMADGATPPWRVGDWQFIAGDHSAGPTTVRRTP